MIVPLDESCPPDTILVTESRSAPNVVADPQGQLYVTPETVQNGTVVTSDLRNEDCPGSRSGDGCE